MQARTMADAIGLLEGSHVEFLDAEAAYMQAKLKENDTWIELPKEQRPDFWHKLLRRPSLPSDICFISSSRFTL